MKSSESSIALPKQIQMNQTHNDVNACALEPNSVHGHFGVEKFSIINKQKENRIKYQIKCVVKPMECRPIAYWSHSKCLIYYWWHDFHCTIKLFRGNIKCGCRYMYLLIRCTKTTYVCLFAQNACDTSTHAENAN